MELTTIELLLLLLGVPGATVAANQGANKFRQRNGSALVEREEFTRFKTHVYEDLAKLREELHDEVGKVREDLATIKITLAVLEERERHHE